MKTIIKTCTIVLAILAVSGCSTWSHSSLEPVKGHNDKVQARKANSAKNIIITESDITDRKYTVIGDINATVNKTTAFNSNPTKEQVNEKLKAEAAEAGADAVIMVRYGDLGASFFSWGSLNGKGRAIVFVK